MARPRLTEADYKTIAYALNCAIEERDGFADAYSYKGKEAEQAMAAVERFKILHRKMFGKASAVETFAHEMAKVPSVPITQLLTSKKAKFGK